MFLLLTGPLALAQVDLGFEDPANWVQPAPYTHMDAEELDPHGGERALRMVRERRKQFAVGHTLVPVEPWMHGQELVVEGWVRTERVRGGYAGWWVRVDGEEGMLALDNMGGRGLRGSSEWTLLRARVPIAAGARRALVGPIFTGRGEAWFDDLSLSVGGEPIPERWLPRSAQEQSPEPWSPEERRSEEDPRAAEVPAAWVDEAGERATPLHSLVSEDFSDLAGLGEAIGEARVVQLGESSHGVSEYNHAKVRIIKYLHQEMGFSVVAFESGLWECAQADAALGQASSVELMRQCIFAVWHTEEVRELFDYLGEQARTDRPLHLAGFDVQSSSAEHQAARPAFLQRVYAGVDATEAQALATADQALTERIQAEESNQPIELQGVGAQLDAAIQWAESHASAAVEAGSDPQDVALAVQLLRSRRAFAEQLSLPRPASFAARDSGMADNLLWLAQERLPGERLVVWAHNGHIAHLPTEGGEAPMGLHIKAALGEQLYTLGLYGYRGATAMNHRKVIPLQRPGPNSLEATLHRLGQAAVFVDLGDPPPGERGRWMTEPIPTFAWGVNTELLPLARTYDGLLFIDTLTPPDYLPRPE